MSSMDKKIPLLHKLAKFYGVQFAYVDVFKKRHNIASEIIVAILKALHAPIESNADIKNALREQTLQHWNTLLKPITIFWHSHPARLLLYLPAKHQQEIVQLFAIYEHGESESWDISLKTADILEQQTVEGQNYLIAAITLPKKFPLGYHQLRATLKEQSYHSTVICAPEHAHAETHVRRWGIFSPLYALHSETTWGVGDFSSFHHLIDWLSAQQGNLLSTLPLFANFLEKSCEPSPYSPITRLFFNELYLDIPSIAEFPNNCTAQQLFQSTALQTQLQKLKSNPLIHYQEAMALKRSILEVLANEFFANGHSDRKVEFEKFLQNTPAVENYAQFRALHERLNKSWHKWPKRFRQGEVSNQDYDERIRNFYLYAQWQTNLQLNTVFQHAKQKNVDLYLDMPLGVHPAGFDAWQEKDLFALDLSVGAAPDATFATGQDWGFAPINAHRYRETGYSYFIRSLKTILPMVDLLRLDHVMGLHRLYCIPKGFDAKHGAFIRYPADELYAILCLESRRHKTCLVGENLGTVPQHVSRGLDKHHLYKMYVVEYEIASDNNLCKPIPLHSVASLNTHDMPPFAAFVQGRDIKQETTWKTRTLFNPQRKLKLPRSKLRQHLLDCLLRLSKSRSQFMLINLEDLWLETRAQNVPTSGKTYPNWRRKTRYKLEDWTRNPEVCATLNIIAKQRMKLLKRLQKRLLLKME